MLAIWLLSKWGWMYKDWGLWAERSLCGGWRGWYFGIYCCLCGEGSTDIEVLAMDDGNGWEEFSPSFIFFFARFIVYLDPQMPAFATVRAGCGLEELLQLQIFTVCWYLPPKLEITNLLIRIHLFIDLFIFLFLSMILFRLERLDRGLLNAVKFWFLLGGAGAIFIWRFTSLVLHGNLYKFCTLSANMQIRILIPSWNVRYCRRPLEELCRPLVLRIREGRPRSASLLVLIRASFLKVALVIRQRYFLKRAVFPWWRSIPPAWSVEPPIKTQFCWPLGSTIPAPRYRNFRGFLHRCIRRFWRWVYLWFHRFCSQVSEYTSTRNDLRNRPVFMWLIWVFRCFLSKQQQSNPLPQVPIFPWPT